MLNGTLTWLIVAVLITLFNHREFSDAMKDASAMVPGVAAAVGSLFAYSRKKEQ